MRLLVVEDHSATASKIHQQLSPHYVIDLACSANDALFMARANDYQLSLIDLKLPDFSGYKLINEIRSDQINFPILITSCCSAPHRIARALNNGADGYLIKPYADIEMLARIRALLRRKPQQLNNQIEWQDIKLNTDIKTLCYKNKIMRLRRKQFLIMECFLNRAGSIVTRQILVNQAWDDYDISRNTVDVQISQLRKKIKRQLKVQLIQTVHGFGYTLKPNSD